MSVIHTSLIALLLLTGCEDANSKFSSNNTSSPTPVLTPSVNPETAKWIAKVDAELKTNVVGSAATSPTLPLHDLSWKVTDDEMDHVATMSKLYDLNLNRSNVTDAGLAKLSGLTQLMILYFQETKVTDNGLAHLQNMKELFILGVGKTSITGTGFAKLKNLPMLKSVVFRKNPLTDEGLAALATVKSIKIIWFHEIELKDAQLAYLTKMPGLEQLHFESTSITDEGLEHLKTLKKLWWLELKNAAVTDKGVADFRAAMPNVEVVIK